MVLHNETGEYESTGGKKRLKRISINPAYRYAVGIRITAKHAGFVLVNLKYEIEKYERIRSENFQQSPLTTYNQVADYSARFLSDEKTENESWDWNFNSGNY